MTGLSRPSGYDNRAGSQWQRSDQFLLAAPPVLQLKRGFRGLLDYPPPRQPGRVFLRFVCILKSVFGDYLEIVDWKFFRVNSVMELNFQKPISK